MIFNYLKLAIRILLRNPFMTFINIAGLSVGLATFLMLWPLAEYELGTDKYHKDAERIIHVGVDYRWTDDGKNWNGFLGAVNWLGVAHQIEKTFQQVESTCWIVPQFFFRTDISGFDSNLFVSVISKSEERTLFRESHLAIASSNLFNFYNIPLLEGNKSNILSNPDAVVLSRSTAVKYFGEEKALGKTVYLNDTLPLQVTGVFEDLPHNTHHNFSMVLSSAGNPHITEKGFDKWFGYCYVKLKDGYNLQSFNEELTTNQAGLYDFVANGCSHCKITAYPQLLTDVVFSKLRASDYKYKSRFLLEALALVGFIVLGFAWINYIGLSVNSLYRRLQEIGTRKSVGAEGHDFFFQFLIESLLTNFIAFGIALTLVQMMSRIAEDWFKFYIPSWNEISITTSLVTMLILGLGVAVATFFPLFLVTRHKPTELLKKSRGNTKSGRFSGSLVTVQYIVATVLLVWIGVVYFQLNYILNKDIGISKDGLVVVNGPASMNDLNKAKATTFLTEAKRIPGVIAATRSHSTVGDSDLTRSIDIKRPGSSVWFGTDTNGGVDESFIETYDIKLLAGRNFLSDNPSDKKSILVSAAAARRLGFRSSEEALGGKVVYGWAGLEAEGEIVGVFKDYEFRPFFSDMTENGRGITLTYKDYAIAEFTPQKITLKIDIGRAAEILNNLEQLYQSTYQESMKWTFLDEKIRLQYADDEATKNQLAFFSVLAVGITCLGLLGMISNKAVEKTKEIGIRKIMGARMYHIAKLLLNTTVGQVIIANLIGIPLAYYFVQQYLLKFSERMETQWWHYVVPAAMLVVIMLLTITSVLYKAARTNPTESLRYE